MQVFKNNVSLEATPASDTHIVNKAYLEDRISKINVQHAVKVDELPICTDNGDGTYTVAYVKDGTTETTTDTSQWFYFLDDNGNLKQTIFLEGEELTIDGAEIALDDFIEKSAIVTTLLDDTVTDEQVVSAKVVHTLTKNKNLKTYTELAFIGLDKTNFTLEEVANNLVDISLLMVGTDKNTPNIFPKTFGSFMALRKANDKVKFFFFPNEDNERNAIYFCGYHPRIGVTEWQRVCTTSHENGFKELTADELTAVSKTGLTITKARYYIKNGFATVFCAFSFENIAANVANSICSLVPMFPQPRYSQDFTYAVCKEKASQTTCYGAVTPTGLFSVCFANAKSGKDFIYMTTYPISETATIPTII